MTPRREEALDPETVAVMRTALDDLVPPQAAPMLADHLALVTKWNRAYNLTAVVEPTDMVTRHVLDCAAALPFLRGRRMLDAGSGAGFPGLVLAILAPDTRWVLADSVGKKARFLDHAVRRLGLGGRVSVYQGRLECYQPAEPFDTVTARALAELPLLASWVAPLLARDARVVALKGRRAEVEREAADLGPEWRIEIVAVTIPGDRGERHIAVLEKASGT